MHDVFELSEGSTPYKVVPLNTAKFLQNMCDFF